MSPLYYPLRLAYDALCEVTCFLFIVVGPVRRAEIIRAVKRFEAERGRDLIRTDTACN